MKRSLTLNGLHAIAAINLGFALKSDAAIIYSGVVNIPIPATIDGIYLNVVTGATGSSGSAVPGYDINTYSGLAGANFYVDNRAGPPESRGYVSGVTGGTSTGPALNLFPAQPMGPDNTYNVNVASAANFIPGQSGLLGFRFQNEANGNAVHYGWARIEVPTGSSVGTAGRIVDYAYSNVAGLGFYVGTGVEFPEPTSLSSLALGAIGLAARRR